MGFYFGQARIQRKEFLEAYQRGAYAKAAVVGEQLLMMHEENGEGKTMEYAVDAHNLAMVLDQLTLHDKAIKYYKKAAEVKKICKGETATYADTLNNLAVIYSEQGKYEQAVQEFRKVLEIRDLKLGRCHVDYIHTLYNLGNTYAEMGALDRALELHHKALQRGQMCKDVECLDMADINNAIGFCYDEKGNYKKSMVYYENTLDLIEKVRGVNNYYYMVTVLALAGVCEKSGFLSLAVEYCERAIEIRSTIMTEGNIDFITNRNYLATICYKDGQFERALKYHQEVLTQITEILGEKHLLHAEVLGRIATDYLGKKEYEVALSYARRAYMEKQAMLELNDVQISGSMMVLGAIYVAMGAYEQALGWYSLALEKRMRAQGEESPLCADTYCAIAQGLVQQGLLEAAFSCYWKALAIRHSLGVGQEDYISWILHAISELRQKQGEHGSAIHFALFAFSVAQARWGQEHPKYAKALIALSKAYASAGDLERALIPLEEALAVQREVLDEDNPKYLETLEELARLSFLRGEYARAIQLYRERNEVNFEETPADQRSAATTFLAIANCYFKMGEDAKAADYFAEGEGRLKRSKLPAHESYERERHLYFQLRGYEGKDTPQRETPQVTMDEDMVLYLEEGYEKGLNKVDTSFTSYLCAMALGEFYEARGLFQEAEQWYLSGKTASEDMYYAFACRCLGKLYLHMGQAQKAVRPLVNAKEYLEEYGDGDTEEYYEILGLLGDALYKINRQEDALEFYSSWNFGHQELELGDTHLRLERLERMVTILIALGRRGEAVEYFHLFAAAVRKEKGEGAEYILVLLKIATLYLTMEEREEAEEVLDQVLLHGGALGIQSHYFARLSDTVGQMYAAIGLFHKAESALGWAYACSKGSVETESFITKEGLSLLEELQQGKEEGESCFSLKNGQENQ